ncbi:unnamed protein product [Symbiodinium sp. KB8]|nr:unnamed protein product [Symbiodinium sp. KB8]
MVRAAILGHHSAGHGQEAILGIGEIGYKSNFWRVGTRALRQICARGVRPLHPEESWWLACELRCCSGHNIAGTFLYLRQASYADDIAAQTVCAFECALLCRRSGLLSQPCPAGA